MKILIISGFLGAGKTTFIKELVQKTEKKFVILENEFSNYSVDKERLESELGDNELDIFEITSGCVCCNMKGDFSSSLITIENTLNPDYLVIEPSGVSVLSSLKENIKKVEYERIKILNTITIIDSTTYFDYKREFEDLLKDYILNSKIIRLSKTENLDSRELELIKKDILKFNKNIEIITDIYSNLKEEFYNELIKYDEDEKEIIKNKVELSFKSKTFKNIKFNSIDSIVEFLEKIVHNYYGNIVRAKGIINFDKFHVNFDIVNKSYFVETFLENKDSEFVVIGNNFNENLLNKEIENY